MRHLVTGGAGFVGSHLVDRLLARGERVEVIDDLSGGRLDNLDPALLRLHRGTVLDAELVDRLVAAADRVWHLAAVVGVPRVLAQPLHAMRVNAHGAAVVLAACARRAVPVVLFSSSEVYGERAEGDLREDDPLTPGRADRLRGSYGASKALAEWTALGHAREDGLSTLTVRLFNTVGPRQCAGHGMVLPRFVEQALGGGPLTVHGDGRQQRCFADVRDVVDHVIRLADVPGAWGGIFNVGGDRETAILDLAETVRWLAGTSAEIVHVPLAEAFPGDEPDIRRRVPNLRRLRDVLGSVPSTSLRATIEAVLADRREPDAPGVRPRPGGVCSRVPS